MEWLQSKKAANVLVSIGLLLVLIACSWSLFRPGFFWIHDPLHAARMGEMLIALQDAHLPPRWSQNFGYGYGIPLFEFYAPLPYFVGAVFLAIGLPLEWAFKLLFLIPSLVAILGAYFLGQRIMGRAGGVLLATLFGLAPYRAVNLFVRGAISESWAMMTFPWIILGGLQVLKGEKYGRWILIISTVTLLLSHNITTLLFMPLAVLFTVGWWWLEHRQQLKHWQVAIKPLITYVASLALSAGLASFYLLPALGEKSSVSIDVTTSDYYNFANHFLYIRQFITPFWGYGNSIYGPGDGLSFFLGWGTLLGLTGLLLVGLFVLLKWLRTRHIPTKAWIALLALSGFAMALAMTLEKTSFIWSNLSLLAYSQFPWRFLSVAAIFSAIAITLATSLLPYRKLQLGLLLTLIGFIINTQSSYFQPRELLRADQTTYYTTPTKIRAEMGDTLLEYLPVGLPKGSQPSYQLINLPENSYQVLTDQVQWHTLKVNLPTATTVTWNVSAFPGWTTKIDDQVVEYQTTNNGLISINVPAGEHDLELSWGYTNLRLLSDTISLASLLILLFWAASSYRRSEMTYGKQK